MRAAIRAGWLSLAMLTTPVLVTLAASAPALAQDAAAMAVQIERTGLSVGAAAMRLGALADQIERLPPAAAARALNEARRASPALTSILPPPTTRSSPETAANAVRALRDRSEALSIDATALLEIGRQASSAPTAETIGRLQSVPISHVSVQVIAGPPNGAAIVTDQRQFEFAGLSVGTGLAVPFTLGGSRTIDRPAVGALVYRNSQGDRRIRCTATLVAPNAVLTARHCVDPAYFRTDRPDEVFFHHVGFVPVSTAISPAWPSSSTGQPARFPTDDLAIVFLSHPITDIQPMELNDGPAVAINSIGEIVGFGFRNNLIVPSGTDVIRETGIKVFGSIRTEVCPSTVASATLTGIPMICWTATTSAFGLGTTCYSDSGGPLLVLLSGRMVLAGVTSGGVPGCPLGQTSYSTEVAAHISWIRARLAAHPPALPAPWSNPLHPHQNPERFETRLSEAGAIFPANGSWQTLPAIVGAGNQLLRLTVNGSATPEAVGDLPLRRFVLSGPFGRNCSIAAASIAQSCDVVDPPAGDWSVLVEGRRHTEFQMSVVAFRRAN
jgi:hypothetical protein